MFGTTQVVRRANHALLPSRVGVGRVETRRAEVRVGRDAPGRTRVGADAAAMAANTPEGGGSCGTGFDWSKACDRPLSVARNLVPAGTTVIYNVTPCGPYKLSCIVIPESFAQLFSVTKIKVCRTDYIDAELPAEAFTTQGNYACSLGCGSVFYSSQPLQLGVRNDSGAAAYFSAMILGKELDMCG